MPKEKNDGKIGKGGKGKRSMFSAGLQEATKRSYDTKDSTYSPTYLKNAKKLSFWQCKDGNHLIDVIPYIAGPNDPNANEGDPVYVLDVWVHRGVGAVQKDFVCPSKNFNKRCPICEKQMEMRKSGKYSDEEIKGMSPKRRTLYNIVCWDTGDDMKKGVQVWEISHFFFENHIAEISKRPKKGGFVVFSDPDEGKSIAFKKVSKGSNMEFLGHRFEDRDSDDPISDDLLDAATTLDELLIIPTLNELKEAVAEGFAVEEDEEPKRKRGKQDEEEEEDSESYEDEDDDEDDEVEEDKPRKPSKKTAKVDEDEDEDDGEDEDEDEEDEAPKKPSKPSKPSKPAKKPAAKPSYEDEDEDEDSYDDEGDDDEDEEEEIRPVRKKTPGRRK